MQRATNTSTDAGAPPADPFVDGTQQGLAYLGRHRRAVMAASVASLLLAAAATTFVSQRSRTAQAASTAFARALSLLEAATDEDRAQLAEARRARDAQLAEAEAADVDGPVALGDDEAGAGADDGSDDGTDAEEGDGAAAGPVERGARARRAKAARRAAQRKAELRAEAAEAAEARRQNLPTFATRKARDAAGTKALLEVFRRWPKQPVAALAALQGANLAARAGDVDTAEATYAALYARLDPSTPAWPLVAARHAHALRRSGDLDGAAAALQRVAGSEHRLLADEAALERAYLLEERGGRDAAIAELEDMTLKFPDSALQDEVRAELSALRVESPGSEGAAPSSPKPALDLAHPAAAPAAAGPKPVSAER